MVLGAAASGARTMTSSSSPGISLKSEGLSYMAGSDVPCLILNVQRGGPGLGGIQPAQSDYYQATKANGHGDLHLIVLAPSSIQEAADFTTLAFELGDKYRIPVMMLADGALGQMMEPVEFKEVNGDALPEKPWATTGTEGKRKKNIINSLFIKPDELEDSINARFERYAEIEKNEVRCEEYMTEDADIVIVSYGITSRICKTAISMARKEGIKVGMVRPITLWPYPNDALAKAAKTAKEFLVVELNKGQMTGDVKLAIECSRPVSFYGRTGGMLPSVDEVYDKLTEMSKKL
jgi:2-oxoglutarate ferredoxin oxidoreductase subunit alpha